MSSINQRVESKVIALAAKTREFMQSDKDKAAT